MATTKKPAAEAVAPDETTDMVQLKCEVLGIESQAFTPAHAKALLKFQADKGLSDWQPVDTAPVRTDA